jgi:serine/threonine-protein kinase RsbW
MSKATYDNLVIPSLFEEVERVESYLDELQQWADFNDDDFARIMLALSEAATNAIMHGNKQDPTKDVVISTALEGRTLLISVKDEGEGFDPSCLPDPLKEENLMNEGGRGVFLIGQYADRVTYTEKGTRLNMAFDLKA